ncbi:hypothetical protein PPERSA_08918 [Pseudocohnilembus persalinus]|uniref:Transmembrane protein n=1 Tax=Pseudocohnilembus persalinus TaxID=266149 RepID=A0A0V0R2R0_PSEPJ|nr:hypothetical protein PPERSA_08918 [Pseudocohnilembus persalinus]|eukprot:KRX08814.1 hypothetical protein PPERSA_08918 [Pseudocohnilembus persalinus]
MKNYNENKENFSPNFNFKDEKQHKKSHFNTDPAEKFQKYYQYQQYQNDKQSHNNNNNINEIFNQNYTNSQFNYNPNQSQHYTTPKQPRTPFNTPVQENNNNKYDNINNNYIQQEQESEVNFKQLLMGKNMVDKQQKYQNNNNNLQNQVKSGSQRHKQFAKTKSQLKVGVLFIIIILFITQIIGANSSQTYEELDKAEQILLEYSQTDFGEFQNDTYMEAQNINILEQQNMIQKQKNNQNKQQQPLINYKKQSQQVQLDESESIIQNEQNNSNNNIVYSQQASQKVIENITKQVYEDLNQYLFEHQQYAQKDFIEFLESEYSSSTVNSLH